MKDTLISIIITVLNGEKTIVRCLESINCQLFTNYEVVIIDGGSTDNTLSIIESCSIIDKVLHIMPNIGLYAGLNVGIGLARGEWLYFIGCDDILYNCEVLTHIAYKIDANKRNAKVFAGSVMYESQRYIMHPKLGCPYLLRYRIHPQGTFYHRSVFESIRYNESLRISSDYELNLKLFLAGVDHYIIDVVVAVFGEEGISSKKPELSFSEIRQIHEKIFIGLPRFWIIIYCRFKQELWLFRRKHKLLNVKYRLANHIRVLNVFKVSQKN